MPSKEDLLVGTEGWRATATATNGVATATRAAPTNQRHFITGFSISATGTAPAAGSYTAQIRQNGGGTVRRDIAIPAAAFAPIIYEFRRPIEIPRGQDCDITLPALGAGAVGRVELFGITRD
jgi:hypothetical protein